MRARKRKDTCNNPIFEKKAKKYSSLNFEQRKNQVTQLIQQAKDKIKELDDYRQKKLTSSVSHVNKEKNVAVSKLTASLTAQLDKLFEEGKSEQKRKALKVLTEEEIAQFYLDCERASHEAMPILKTHRNKIWDRVRDIMAIIFTIAKLGLALIPIKLCRRNAPSFWASKKTQTEAKAGRLFEEMENIASMVMVGKI